MSEKIHIATVDIESSKSDKVVDFAMVISDRKGNNITQCAVLINGIFNDAENHPLFYYSDPNGIWDKAGLDARYDNYMTMLHDGRRSLASVNAVNKWINRVITQYNPVLTAYNLKFDKRLCQQSGIDLSGFKSEFCLWDAAYTILVKTKKFRRFILENHYFKSPSKCGYMTWLTTAEIVTRYVLNDPMLDAEPHTALEDILEHEIYILNYLLARKSVKKLISESVSYDWRQIQVKDWFKPV